MKFIVHRTSDWLEKNAPCKGAKLDEYIYIDRRTVKTLKDARKYWWGEEYLNNGTNHREEYGMIARDLKPVKKWTIEIYSLEDLLKLQKKEGNLIIHDIDDLKGIELGIEIYDDYRE